jgi:DNA polymerase I-like protein with 3'-5' exonuclease and polymerase domains
MLNHNTTVTTRLASSNPNAQNIPRGDKSEVKAMFTSRFKDGVMGEIDYSQLEVIVQGWLSGDANMCADIRNQIDFHCKRVGLKNDIAYEKALVWCKDEDKSPDFDKWKKERTKCKIFSFQRAYGAGAATIADETGMSVDAIKEMIIAEDKEYPGIAIFNARVQKIVTDSSVFFRDGERGYRPFRKGQWQCPTGTIYEWRSWDSPKFLRDKGVMDSFSPPELMNYPVQGTGGELVQLALGVLWRWFVANDNFGGRAFLVNTVHDCVWFDMQPDMVDIVMPGAMKIMSALPKLIKLKYGLECNVPFPVDAETGINMLDLHHYTPPTP